MKRAKYKIAYLNVNRFNPALCDGVSASSLELLRFLMGQGHEAVVMTFYTGEHHIKKIFRQAMCRLDSELRDKNLNSYSHMVNGILAYEELFPFKKSELSENQDYMLKSMIRKIKNAEINYLITVEDDFLSLLLGSILGIPGAHFFHSPTYLSYYRQFPSLLKPLKKKKLFAASGFLQAKIKKELDLDSDLWYPLFDLGKYRTKEKENLSRHAGYYSAGWHKGDDIVNRLVLDIPNWNFTVIGRYYTHGFDKIPGNLELWGDNPDFRRFYDSIGLLLVPSLKEEGFPRVILEAAANGIPAIANSLGGIPEALGNSGILVESNAAESEHLDTKKLAAIYQKYIERIDTDRGFYEELQRRAINRAQVYERKQAELSKINLKTMFGV